jgi:hypothetical protein
MNIKRRRWRRRLEKIFKMKEKTRQRTTSELVL